MKKKTLNIKQQAGSAFGVHKAGWLAIIFGLLLLPSLTAQLSVQRYTDSDTRHYYDVEVPAGFQYVYLLAKGADGGSTTVGWNSRIWGGEGVRASGFVSIGNGDGKIPVGSTLRLIPGQAGSSESLAGGGGGGTAIAFKAPDANAGWVLLLVAGGGGGASSGKEHGDIDPYVFLNLVGKAATTHLNGLDGEDSQSGLRKNGGKNGNGGSRKGSEGYPGGGALSDGQGGCPGKAGFRNGEPVGGAGGGTNCDGVVGGGFGFGGGGSGMQKHLDSGFEGGGGGGGGGYSGGGGGNDGSFLKNTGPGGGGGSYANADYVQMLSMQSFGISPSNDGYVLYEFVNPTSVLPVQDQTRCLDSWGTDNGANILLNPCTGSNYQRWLINNSAFRFSKTPGRCLDLDHSNTSDGTNIQLWDCNGTNAQNWIYDVANQAVRSSIDVDKCLELANGKTADQTNIQLNRCQGSAGQKWLMEGVQSALPSGKDLRIHLLIASDKCLDIDQAYTGANGNNIRLYTCQTINHSQYFTFDGRRIKMQLYPNKCLDLDHSNTTNGSNIQLWDCNGTDAQNWIYDGFTRTFRSAIDPAKCLDLDHSMITNYTNIQIWDCNGSGAQQFEIY